MLATMAAAAGCALVPTGLAFSDQPWKASKEDEAFLDDLERQGCLFFWEQGSPKTGQILDRARNDLNGGRDPRRMASIAATGFGLTALCIADHRRYLPHARIVERVKTTLEWHLNAMPEVHGFFYHFTDIETGDRVKGVELSERWDSFKRPVIHYQGFDYIGGNDPIFTHQYSQAWYDFRGKRDAYADYFENSVTATRAHKAFCLSYPKWYSEDYWGITASDYEGGYTAWGGPPAQGPLDGTVVPSAAAGSLAFLPAECLSVLRDLRAKWGKQAWGRYGFVDAFHPAANWYDPDVLGIDQGISVLMAENLRSGMVWATFMRNHECVNAMRRAGFHGKGLQK
jgi:hypothetical protein